MQRLTVVHRTVYDYTEPVTFGPHRLMMRPRDSHDLRLTEALLAISPPAEVRWLHDVFGNSIAIASFSQAADRLEVTSTIRLEHYGMLAESLPLEAHAEIWPFAYDEEERADLGPTLVRHCADRDGAVAAWARRFAGRRGGRTRDILAAMTRSVPADFTYARREEAGVQHPADTLAWRSGSCRDFALLMMEGVRSLGLAARFVTGYLYDPAVEAGGAEHLSGAGATHAWVQVYLPGAGWVEFDPTNGIIGGANLIRVAVARAPAQAVPLAGTFTGPVDAFIGMDVTVTVTSDPG